MKDSECIEFLQWSLPRLQMRWEGFRKVRAQVCKRVRQRLRELDLSGTVAYRSYLKNHPEEWRVLDDLCHITISRFYRDRGVFEHLERQVLPELAARATGTGKLLLQCWSAGCASGEEAYTLAILWGLRLMERFPTLDMRILATDVDENVLQRAREGCYDFSSLKEFPQDWLTQAFTRSANTFCVRSEYRKMVEFAHQDLRTTMPQNLFHLILCRNSALTYFDVAPQQEILRKLRDRLEIGGALVIGIHESLPQGIIGFKAWPGGLGVYQRF